MNAKTLLFRFLLLLVKGIVASHPELSKDPVSQEAITATENFLSSAITNLGNSAVPPGTPPS